VGQEETQSLVQEPEMTVEPQEKGKSRRRGEVDG